jgi:hypothetical protein
MARPTLTSCISLLLSAVGLSSALAQEQVTLDMADGFALKKSCLAVDTEGRTLPKASGEKVAPGIGCWSYVIFGYTLVTKTEDCHVPNGKVDTFPLVDVVRRYLDTHPGELGMPPLELVVNALRPEFSCTKKK